MKRGNKLIILLIVLLSVTIVTLVVKNIKQKKEDIKVSGETIIEVDETTISSLSWVYNGNTYSLIKEDDKWYVSDDKDFPIDDELVSNLTSTIQRVGAGFVVENVEDYNQYGLSSPSMIISFTADEIPYALKLGDYSTMDEERYCNIGDGNVYLLSSDPTETFSITYDDLFAYEEIPDLSDFVEFKVSNENTLDIVYEEESGRAYSDLYVYFLKSDNYKTLSNDLTETLVDRISSLLYTSYVDYKGNLADYGLTEPRIVVECRYLDAEGNEQTFKCNISNNEGDDENDIAYFNIDGSKLIYEVSGTLLNALVSENYESLRPKEVLLIKPSEINEMTISIDDEDYVIVTENEDDDTLYYFNEKEVNFGTCLDELMAIEVEEFTSDKADSKLELMIVIKTNEQDLTLEFYKDDNNYMLYRLNNETIGKVSRSSVIDLIESINAIVLAKEEEE